MGRARADEDCGTDGLWDESVGLRLFFFFLGGRLDWSVVEMEIGAKFQRPSEIIGLAQIRAAKRGTRCLFEVWDFNKADDSKEEDFLRMR